LPETIFTCWTTLIDDGKLKAGETVLIHGGSSGIGTTGIPLAKALGATVYATAGSPEKCAACRALGADLAIDYKTEDFVEVIGKTGREVDVVLDMVGGDYVGRDMQIMARRGRHVSIGLLSNIYDATISIAMVLAKQLVITGSTLRGRTIEQKAAIGAQLREIVWPMIEDGRITPVAHATFPLARAADAHRALEAGGHIGKIVLTID
jgi:NADPH:quinone reductase-like Zn-dependent oxidoreductase